MPRTRGFLVFSDIPGDVLYRVEPDNKVTALIRDVQPTDAPVTAPEHMMGPDGTTIDPQGRITYCVFGGGRIERLPADGKREVLVSSLEDGHPLTLPNDLVYRSDGILYFTQDAATYMVKPGATRRHKEPKRSGSLPR